MSKNIIFYDEYASEFQICDNIYSKSGIFPKFNPILNELFVCMLAHRESSCHCA